METLLPDGAVRPGGGTLTAAHAEVKEGVRFLEKLAPVFSVSEDMPSQ
jgi:hypothetical protein